MKLANSLRIAVLGTLILILVGCAPLQQAPLLYSSKTIIGVDVSATTTETPGASISIGVKMVDAAYVPVAVSKDSQTSSNGDTKAFPIERIEAIYGEGATGSKLDSLTDDNKKKISNYLDAKRTEDLVKDVFDKLTRAVDEATASRDKLKESIATKQKDKDIAKNEAVLDAAAINTLDTEIGQLKDTIAQKDGYIKSESTKRDETEKSWKARKEDAEKLFLAAAQAASLLRTDKRDAMSVYGRFDSKGEGAARSSPSANLAVGKIFSTGVAAQNLTEAVKNDALYAVSARCVEGIKSLVDALKVQANKDNLIGKIDILCRRPDGK